MSTCTVIRADIPNKNESSNTQEVKDITVNFGIFFDGTNNQRMQVALGKIYRAREKGGHLEEKEKNIIESFAWDDASGKKEKGETIQEALERQSGRIVGMSRSSMQGVDYTNIARLEPLYDYSLQKDNTYTYRIYVTGSGTFANIKKGIDVTGLSTGQNSAGVVQKVKDALDAIAAKTAAIKFNDGIGKVKYTFNVFGFSRGATEARLFVDLCCKVRDGKRPKILNKIISKYNKDFASKENRKNKDISSISFVKQGKDSVDFPFVGLFDTVSSVGIDSGIWNYSIFAKFLGFVENVTPSVTNYHEQNKSDLGLNTLVEDGCVKRITHICALDEYRENFALQELPLVSKVDQFFIPGVHADIGGGYLAGSSEGEKKGEEILIPKLYKKKKKTLYLPIVVSPGRSKKKRFLKELNVDNLKQLGWIKDEDVVEEKDDTIKLKRYSEYGYTFLPLNIMANKARKHTCSFKGLTSKYSIPKDLPQSFSEMQGKWNGENSKFGHCFFPLDGNEYKRLRQKYLHFSSCIEKTMGLAFVNAPNLTISNDDEAVLYFDRFLPMERIKSNDGSEEAVTSNQKGNFGEIKADEFIRESPLLKGCDFVRLGINPPQNQDSKGRHGIDGVYINKNYPQSSPLFLISEVKYNKAQLGKLKDGSRQMSNEWIIERLAPYFLDCDKKTKEDKIREEDEKILKDMGLFDIIKNLGFIDNNCENNDFYRGIFEYIINLMNCDDKHEAVGRVLVRVGEDGEVSKIVQVDDEGYKKSDGVVFCR